MMKYKSSPRPNFEKPTQIKYKNMQTYIWGDKEAGFVKDWIYLSNKNLHQIIFGMEAKGFFKHSKEYRTIFGADELLYVLSGILIINNPETGETHKINKGESVFFRKDTWHHAFNYSNDYLQVLEFFSPPPSTGTSGLYAKKKKLLKKSKYTRKIRQLDKKFKNQNSFKIIRENDYVWEMYGEKQEILIANIIETEFIKVKKICLIPNQVTPLIKFKKETIFLSLSNIDYKIKNINKKIQKLSINDGLFLTKNSECFFKNTNKVNGYLIYCEANS